MEHIAHGGAAAGTFGGHVLPGSLLIAWALYWMVMAYVRGFATGEGGALESNTVLPWVKIALATVGVVVEIPGEGWLPQDVMTNWQHVAMYAVFGLSGVVDLLARRGLLSGGATYGAYAAAMANAGLLFWGHSGHAGVEGLVHAILALLFFAVAVLAVVEMARPSAGTAWGRTGAQLALGSWFIVAAWILYRSGWDLADPVREGWTLMALSWTAATVAVLTLAARRGAKARHGS
jgi:hypothetical protein